MKQQAPRSRPTNNQLLYKAYFRWEHYRQRSMQTDGLPRETEPCASVTTAFLKVLDVLQQVESMCQPRRNILQILATNTRRTKVLELSSGTHRIPEELKKHYLTDETGARYSTNLDRNRYGPDNNYLFTVIKNDLEALGLCTNLVEIEIIDSKAHAGAQLVSANDEACECCKMQPTKPPPRPTPSGHNPMFDMLLAAAADASAAEEAEDNVEREADLAASRPGPVARGGDARSPTQRRRAPRRTPTGMFSLHSSDLVGLSALGNSGVAVGDVDLDVKNEVDQAPHKRRRGLNGDDVSEQGDTERMMNGYHEQVEGQPALPLRRPPPREESKVLSSHGAPTLAQLNVLRNEVKQMQHGYQRLSKLVEGERESHINSLTSMRQSQELMRQMQHALSQLHTNLHDVQQRLDVLESVTKPAVAHASVMHNVLVGLLTGTHSSVLLERLQSTSQPKPSAPVSGPMVTVQLDPNGGSHATPPGVHAEAPRTKPMAMPPTAPDVTVVPNTQILPASLNRLSMPASTGHLEAALAPIPHLKHTGSSLEPAHNGHNASMSGLNAMAGGERASDLAEPASQIDLNQRIEDTQMMRNLPVFDKFESISDFGSLFSAGGAAGARSEHVGGRPNPSRAPPRAHRSITSRAPLLVTNSAEEQQVQAAQG